MNIGIGINWGGKITAGGSGPTTGVSLAAVPASKVFQRTLVSTGGPVHLSGAYTGGAPTGIQAKILLAADNSTVVDWTTLTGGTVSAGSWNGSLTVPNGGTYYAQVRALNDTSLTATGATNWSVGDVIVCNGQSNMLGLFTNASSSPAASAKTYWFDHVNLVWGTPQAANGLRTMLNAVVAQTGIPVAAVCVAQTGNSIEQLSDPNGSLGVAFQTLGVAGITDSAALMWNQGEGNSNSGTSELTYNNLLSSLHQTFADLFGRTKAQFPLLVSSLTTFGGGATNGNTDPRWQEIRKAHVDAATQLTNCRYVSSNMDAVRTDDYHQDAASQARHGARLARGFLVALGSVSGLPAWFLTAASIVDATHTDVTAVHSTGTDFTPTSGITGFEVSGDNGGTWAAPTAARQSATSIRLTHGTLDTSISRLVRYQYGMLPDVSAPVKDNGTLASPLNYTADPLTAAGSVSLPTPTYRTTLVASGGASKTTSSFSTGTAAATRRALVFVIGANTAPDSVTVTPDTGSPVTLTQRYAGSSGFTGALLYDGLVPTGTTCTVTVAYAAEPFNDPKVYVWTIDDSQLSSTTPVDADSAYGTTTNVDTVSISTSSGGFVLVASMKREFPEPTGAITGSATFAERANATMGGVRALAADAANTGTTTNAFACTATYSTTGTGTDSAVVAASWR